MKNGKPNERTPELKDETDLPEVYLACARWLLDNPDVLEVWGLVSDLPEIAIPGTAVTLDAGSWFLCRVNLPPIPDESGIICFVPQEQGRGQSAPTRHDYSTRRLSDDRTA